MGFDAALRSWRNLLLPGGFIGLSELAWRRGAEDAPEKARKFFDEAYPAMRSDADNRSAFEACGYELLGGFVLPSSDWWLPYYEPMQERLSSFLTERTGEVARAVAESAYEEIEIFRECGDAYGYFFYVGRMR